MVYNYTALSDSNISHNVQAEPPSSEDALRHYNNTLQQLETTRFVVVWILMPIVVAFGLIGNILNICVLTRRWMRSSTNYYLTALAVFDILYLVFAMSLVLHRFSDTLNNDYMYKVYTYNIGIPFVNVLSNTGVSLTLTFTVERYIGVCHPMKGKRWCTPQRAKYIICAVFFFSFILTSPTFLEWRVYVGENGTLNYDSTSLAKHVVYAKGYTWINQSLFAFIPLCLLLIFNTLLVRAVTIATKQRQEMSGQNDRQVRHQREQIKITIMLIVVVVVFLVCQLPQAFANLYGGFAYMSTLGQIRLGIFNIVCNMLVMVNSSINFVLYSSLSLKFRRTFRVLFCRCCASRRPVHFIFSEVFSTGDTRNGNGTRTTKGASSPYASSPLRHAHSYVSINVNVNLTPLPSPTPSYRAVYVNRSPCMSRNGCLAVNQIDKFV